MNDEQYDRLEQRLDVIVALLKELVEIARVNWGSEDETMAPPISRGSESFRNLIKTAAAGADKDVSTRDFADVWDVGTTSDPYEGMYAKSSKDPYEGMYAEDASDPLTGFYELEKPEIKAEVVPKERKPQVYRRAKPKSGGQKRET